MTREDADMLRALEPSARRSMENLLLDQARGNARWERMIETSELEALERLAGERRARAMFGTGGGRVRRPVAEPS